MDNIKEVHILNHTHWDREWYETFEEFRYKLRNGLRYIQDLLETGRIENFFLDGQTIVLDDYREVVSKEEYNHLVSFIKEGKIQVGPWYLLADEFLVSGESILKNLELGIGKAESYYSNNHIGYLPDTFGHNSQMPQIFQGYHIDSAIVWRGAVSKTFENTWQGADGSRVFTFVLPLFEGYYQTFLKHSDYKDKTKSYLQGNAPYLVHGKALLMNGADHTYTCDDIKERIKQLNYTFPSIKFKQSLLSDYVRAFQGLEATETIIGEQRDPSKIFILPGVYSTRTYLKRQNQQCEDEAIGTMEALNAWTNGKTNSEQFIEYVWKLILQNQPHDSICGCSIDEVHQEMETRTQKVLSAIKQFATDTLNDEYPFEYLNNHEDNAYLYIVNNTPIADIYPVTTQIFVPASLDLGSIKLFHEDKEIVFDCINRQKREEFLRHILKEPHYGEYVVYDVSFNINFGGVETKRIRIERVKEEPILIQKEDEKKIKNEFYEVECKEEGLTIRDIQNNILHKHQHQIISSLDAGDTYNYSPPLYDQISEAVLIDVCDVVRAKTFESMKLIYKMKLPASLNKSRNGASSNYVVNKIVVVITLHRGKRLISFKTTVENHSKDQKLRIGFATNRAEESYGDTAFDLVKRSTLREKKLDVLKNQEAVMNQYPTYSSVMVNEHQIVHRGLQEYEVDSYKGRDYIYLTMIRSVGWLSRRDLRTRGNGAGPGLATPEAQCLGTYEFEYGLVLGKDHHSLNNAKAMRQRILTQQSYLLKDEKSLFYQTSEVIAFSSFIQKEEDSFDIRMFNPTLEEQSTVLNFGFEIAGLEEIDFRRSIKAKYSPSTQVTISFKPKQIKTLRVRRKWPNDQQMFIPKK
ncbi:glycoside hydrolase family 38 C-terminal domain-containing protein [Priestia sp. LL-8]|uniref:glycoside hydrolase family 38 N-terminal domain-containing protein n=1 Tax=Priestia sp. LL-8 TaxID=3110068 RepID=UPI002E276246|nr:glycoside hydrolase family 38 C-terminal domain-containing protein [Priestia sp. LL-8]